MPSPPPTPPDSPVYSLRNRSITKTPTQPSSRRAPRKPLSTDPRVKQLHQAALLAWNSPNAPSASNRPSPSPSSASQSDSVSVFTTTQYSLSDLSKWRKADLVAECLRRSLDTRGKKNTLRRRIIHRMWMEKQAVAAKPPSKHPAEEISATLPNSQHPPRQTKRSIMSQIDEPSLHHSAHTAHHPDPDHSSVHEIQRHLVPSPHQISTRNLRSQTSSPQPSQRADHSVDTPREDKTILPPSSTLTPVNVQSLSALPQTSPVHHPPSNPSYFSESPLPSPRPFPDDDPEQLPDLQQRTSPPTTILDQPQSPHSHLALKEHNLSPTTRKLAERFSPQPDSNEAVDQNTPPPTRKLARRPSPQLPFQHQSPHPEPDPAHEEQSTSPTKSKFAESPSPQLDSKQEIDQSISPPTPQLPSEDHDQPPSPQLDSVQDEQHPSPQPDTNHDDQDGSPLTRKLALRPSPHSDSIDEGEHASPSTSNLPQHPSPDIANDSSSESGPQPDPTTREQLASNSTSPSPASPSSPAQEGEQLHSVAGEDLTDSNSKPSDDDELNQSASDLATPSEQILDDGNAQLEDQISTSDNDADAEDVDMENVHHDGSSAEERSAEERDSSLHQTPQPANVDAQAESDLPDDNPVVHVLSSSSGEDADVDSERESRSLEGSAPSVENVDDQLSPEASTNSAEHDHPNSLSDISSSSAGQPNQAPSDTPRDEDSPVSNESLPSVEENESPVPDRTVEVPDQSPDSGSVGVVNEDEQVEEASSDVEKVEQDAEDMEISPIAAPPTPRTAVPHTPIDIDQRSDVQLKIDSPALGERLSVPSTLDVVEQNQPLLRYQGDMRRGADAEISDSRGHPSRLPLDASRRNRAALQMGAPDDSAAVIMQTHAALSKLRQERMPSLRNDSAEPGRATDSRQAKWTPGLTTDPNKSASQTSALIRDLVAPPPSPSPQLLQKLPPRPVTSKPKLDPILFQSANDRGAEQKEKFVAPDDAFCRDSNRQKIVAVSASGATVGEVVEDAKTGGGAQGRVVDEGQADERQVTTMKRELGRGTNEAEKEHPSKRRKTEPIVLPFSGMPSMEQTLSKLRSDIPFLPFRKPNGEGEHEEVNRSLNFETMPTSNPMSILDRLARIEARELKEDYKPFSSICRGLNADGSRPSMTRAPVLFHVGAQEKKARALPIDRLKSRKKFNVEQLAAMSAARAAQMAEKVCGWRVKASPFQDNRNAPWEPESGYKRPFGSRSAADSLVPSKESSLKKRRR